MSKDMTHGEFGAIEEDEYYVVLEEERKGGGHQNHWFLLKDGRLVLGEYGLPAHEKDSSKQHDEFTVWEYGEWTPHSILRIFNLNLSFDKRSGKQKWEIDHFMRCALTLDLKLTIATGQKSRGL